MVVKIVMLVTFGNLMSGITAMYDSNTSKVVNLDYMKFKELVLGSDEMWFVEFYVPWCGHCQQFEPIWEKTAKKLKGVVKVGAVNVHEQQVLGKKLLIRSLPALKFFRFDKKNEWGDPEDYKSGRDVESMTNFAS